MIDYHIHSKFSPDSNIEINDIITRARGLQLDFVITDHYEAVDGDEKFRFNVEEYKKTLSKYSIPIGVEFGWDGCSKIDINLKEFDYVILSYHAFKDYPSPQLTYKNYLKDLYNILKKFEDFHVLGHFDFPRRYTENHEPFSKELYPIISEIFKILIEKGKGIEVNTSSIAKYNEPNPSYEILKIYKDLGGKFITLGSDAHRKEDIGKNIDKVLEELWNLGFKYIMVLNEGKFDMKKIF